MSREAMRRALDALEVLDRVMQRSERTNSAINALRAALSEPENQSQSQIDTKVNPAEPAQKPVAWMCPDDPDRATAFAWNYGYCIDCGKPRIPLFTTRTGDSND